MRRVRRAASDRSARRRRGRATRRRSGARRSSALLAACRERMPAYMVPARDRGARRSAAAQCQRQDRSQGAARVEFWPQRPSPVTDTHEPSRRSAATAAVSARRGERAQRRRHAAVAAGRAGRPHAVLRLRPRAVARACRASCAPRCRRRSGCTTRSRPIRCPRWSASWPGWSTASTWPRRASCASRSTPGWTPRDISFAGPGKSDCGAALRQSPPACSSTSSRCASCELLDRCRSRRSARRRVSRCASIPTSS